MAKKKRPLTILAWIFGYLVLIDLGVNVLFRYPRDPRNISPPAIARFFEFGRSVEGKLSLMTRRTNEASAPILTVGWVREAEGSTTVRNADAQAAPLISLYGMSHTVQLANDMAELEPTMAFRRIGAPGAVPSWSYAAYLIDREVSQADAYVLGIMNIGIPFMCTTSGTTNHFDRVWPYSYPRIRLVDGALDLTWPPFTTLAGYREYFYDREKWASYVNWLEENDKYYDPFLYKRTLLDESSTFRLIRRAYAYSSLRRKEAQIYTGKDIYDRDSEEIRILFAIIEDFAEKARTDGAIPILYIVNNYAKGTSLFDLLEPALRERDIAYLSSHEVCSPNDPRNYLPDEHFIPERNREMAKAMLRVVHRELEKKAKVGVGPQ
jgi:hypothetical protein